MSSILLAAKNVLRNRRRALVTVVITAIGAGALLTAAGFGLSTYAGLETRTAREVGHLVLAHRSYFDEEEELPLALGLDEHEALAARLRADPRVRGIMPRIEFSGLVSNGDKSGIFLGVGVDPAMEFQPGGPPLRIESGQALAGRPAADENAEVMLGRDLARNLRATVGTSLTLLATTADGALNALDVRVVGTFATGTPELDKRKILASLAAAQQLLATARVSTLAVSLHERRETSAVLAEARRAWPSLAVKSWRDLASYYDKVKALYDRIFGVLGFIIVLMVFFAVANTSLMSVIERTREIGALAALGAFPGEIVRGFVLEAVLLGGGGALAGGSFAGLVSLVLPLLDLRMPPPPGMTSGYPLLIGFSWPLAAGTVAVLTLAAAAAAYGAARGKARVRIAEALAHV